MDFTKTVSCQVRVRATLDEDGACAVTVTGSTEYAPDRSVSKSIDPPTELVAAVADALQAVLDASARDCAAAVMSAADEARLIAQQRGEI